MREFGRTGCKCVRLIVAVSATEHEIYKLFHLRVRHGSGNRFPAMQRLRASQHDYDHTPTLSQLGLNGRIANSEMRDMRNA